MKSQAGLLTPGPVAVHPSVLESITKVPYLHHRSEDFSFLLQNIKKNLFTLFKVPESYEIAFVGTSGTGLTEAMIQLLHTLPKNEILFLSNGHFGDRLQGIAKNLRIKYHAINTPATEPFDLEKIEKTIKENPEIGAIAGVHLETSLGQFNDYSAIQALCQKYNLLLGMDMVSSLGGERFTFEKIQPDIGVTVSGKALASFPGVAIAFVKETAIDKLDKNRSVQHFLDLKKYIAFWKENNLLPFTPPIQLFPALNQAIENIVEESLEAKWDRHTETLRIFEEYLEELGFKTYPVHNPSTTTRTYQYSSNQDDVFDKLSEKMNNIGYMLYQNAHYHRPERLFQVSTMGEIRPKHMKDLVEKLRSLP